MQRSETLQDWQTFKNYYKSTWWIMKEGSHVRAKTSHDLPATFISSFMTQLLLLRHWSDVILMGEWLDENNCYSMFVLGCTWKRINLKVEHEGSSQVCQKNNLSLKPFGRIFNWRDIWKEDQTQAKLKHSSLQWEQAQWSGVNVIQLNIIEENANCALYQDIQRKNIQLSAYDLNLRHNWVIQQISDPKQVKASPSFFLLTSSI